ncbi:MAG TPA: ECF-type sigma factor [Phycisphaerales bacterium]|nr:ECF-type sigma factor [Phycisphaerales bacterium]
MTGPSRASVTQVLAQLREGDPQASARLLPLVYEELRGLARGRMAGMRPGQTLQPTALVHEAYIKLVGPEGEPGAAWESRAHFFGAAARAMRNILVEHARRRHAAKRGGGSRGGALGDDAAAAIEAPVEDMVALDEALARLEASDPRAHQVVMLRFFAGLSEEQTAEVMGISARTVRREWAYGRAWLRREMEGEAEGCTVKDEG